MKIGISYLILVVSWAWMTYLYFTTQTKYTALLRESIKQNTEILEIGSELEYCLEESIEMQLDYIEHLNACQK